ncbi:MAG: retention module-containing protein, partial [Pseudomonadales bacterium]|nr:retention module-containing protein [Pseudomonadales bacterium]
MSTVIAIVKSIIGQVFALSPEGTRRLLIEGDRLFAGDQVMTGQEGMISLELSDGRTLDLGRDSQWTASADTPQVAAAPSAELSASELQQAITLGLDPTAELEATAAGAGGATGGGGAAGGGHSAVVLDATGAQIEAIVGYETEGLGFAASNQRDEQASGDNATTVNKVQEGPTATPSTSSGNEDTNIDVALAGTDSDGTIASVQVTTLPPATQGTLFLADGTTPVLTTTVLTPAQAATLVFTPASNFNGTVTVAFTVTDNEGNTSAAANEVITVNNVQEGPTATPSTSSGNEDT